jgi:hypothetical protein
MFFLYACDQSDLQDSENQLSSVKKVAGKNKISTTIIAESGKFEIKSADIRQNSLFITAASTVHADSISVYMQLRVIDANGTILSKGPGGWIMQQKYTWGKRMFMTIELPLPEPGMITIQGFEMINIAGIIKNNWATLKVQIPEENQPKITDIDINIQQWHDNFQAIGYVTLDRPADIRAVLYALDNNGNEIPGDRVIVDLKRHKSGYVAGSYHIVHNSQMVTCVLEIYHNGKLLAKTPYRESKEPAVWSFLQR